MRACPSRHAREDAGFERDAAILSASCAPLRLNENSG